MVTKSIFYILYSLSLILFLLPAPLLYANTSAHMVCIGKDEINMQQELGKNYAVQWQIDKAYTYS